jgi:hypothetical protein
MLDSNRPDLELAVLTLQDDAVVVASLGMDDFAPTGSSRMIPPRESYGRRASSWRRRDLIDAFVSVPSPSTACGLSHLLA